MRKLEPLIARFVDDILRLVQRATADGLRTLLAEEARRPRTRHLSERDFVAEAAAPASSPRQTGEVVRLTDGRSAIAITTADTSPPPAEVTDAEITDPQWLLAMGTPPSPDILSVASAVDVGTALESVSEGPVSTVRETGNISPVRLRANETLARVSGAGVVIRRAR